MITDPIDALKEILKWSDVMLDRFDLLSDELEFDDQQTITSILHDLEYISMLCDVVIFSEELKS